MQTYDLLKFASARSKGSSFLLITQYEMPFINKSEVTKSRKTEKQTANVQMARSVGVVFGLSFLFTNFQLWLLKDMQRKTVPQNCEPIVQPLPFVGREFLKRQITERTRRYDLLITAFAPIYFTGF